MIDFNFYHIWFIFSERATKRDEISTLALTFTSKRQIIDGDSVFFGFLRENINFNHFTSFV